MEKHPTIGGIIRKLRESRGQGLNAFADEAEVDRGNLSRFESGKSGIRDEALARVAATLNVKLWELHLLAEEQDAEQIMAWHRMGARLEPDQRAAAVRLFGHQVDKLTAGNDNK